MELTSFLSLFLVTFHVSILDESHHLWQTFMQDRWWKSRSFKSKICSMLFATYISVEQEVIVTVIMIAFSKFARF